MSRTANVLSVQTLKDFKNSMINFAEEARNALGGVDMELRKMRDWLERDQLSYWQAQVKKRSEDLMQARSDLARRKLTQQGSDAVSDAEQKEAVRETTKRLRAAEEKVAVIKKLIPSLHHAIAEYHSHSQPLGDHLAGGFERALASLEKMTLSLEAYLRTKAPTAPRIAPVEAATGGPNSTGASATTKAEESPTTSVASETETQPANGAAIGSPAPVGEALVTGKTA
jgi:hypothetical protein